MKEREEVLLEALHNMEEADQEKLVAYASMLWKEKSSRGDLDRIKESLRSRYSTLKKSNGLLKKIANEYIQKNGNLHNDGFTARYQCGHRGDKVYRAPLITWISAFAGIQISEFSEMPYRAARESAAS